MFKAQDFRHLSPYFVPLQKICIGNNRCKKIATQSDFDKAGQTSLVFATIFVAKWP